MLNPNAPEFVPHSNSDVVAKDHLADETSAYRTSAPRADDGFVVHGLGEVDSEISLEEIEELETTDGWVRTMALLEELEREHLIELALKFTPAAKIAEIQKRAAVARSPLLKQRSSFKMRVRAA